MKRIRDLNINTKVYWDNLYADREEYLKQTGSILRFQMTLDFIEDGQKFLDIGCGVGVLTSMVKDRYPNCEVWGTDISEKAIEENKKLHQNINYVRTIVGRHSELPHDFDVIFSGEVLEHIDNPQELFSDAYELLKPTGKFIITTPRGNAIQSDEHVWEYEQEDIENFYFNAGFKQVKFEYLPNSEHLMVIYGIGSKE